MVVPPPPPPPPPPAEPGTQPPSVEAAEAAAFLRRSNNLSSNEFLDGVGPVRTRVATTEYVPRSARNLLMGTPESLRSLMAPDSPEPTHRRVASVESVSGKRPQRLVAVRYFLDRPGYGLVRFSLYVVD